jgi:hypothetical protein
MDIYYILNFMAKSKQITRWDYSKRLSNYHFDPAINEDADLPYKLIGRIDGDLIKEYKLQLSKHDPQPNGFLNRLSVQSTIEDKPYTQDYDAAELKFLGLKRDHVFFYNLKTNDNPIVNKIIEAFKFKHAGASFHIQKPGGIFPYHIDEIPAIKNNNPTSILDKNPKWAARFEIQVFDWQPGHVWAVGNTYWKQWRAGDILWHDWRNMPHGTCNLGRSDRVTLQLTGICTQETIDIIENGNFKLSI